MTADRIRKYVIPNLPYVMIFWFFSKCGEAYRLAPGRDLPQKLIGCISALSVTVSKPTPTFDPFDLCVGFIGAAAVYLTVLYKKKHTKKWRKDIEYGSARWSA
jgi:type IV secretion system protein VirD4